MNFHVFGLIPPVIKTFLGRERDFLDGIFDRFLGASFGDFQILRRENLHANCRNDGSSSEKE